MQSAVESVHRAQAAVEAFEPATCAKCGSLAQGHLRSHCDSVTGLRRTVALILARHPELADFLSVVSVRSVDVCESSAEAVMVMLRLELAADPRRLHADGYAIGTWVDAVCEYSDPIWNDHDSRWLVGFGAESWSLFDAYGDELPMLDGGSEWWVLRGCMDHVAEREVEARREIELRGER